MLSMLYTGAEGGQDVQTENAANERDSEL